MAKIGVRELRQHASRYIERVRAGESIDVTLRGLVVARLVPPASDPWTDLVDAGRVQPPRESLLEVAPIESSVDLSSELDELRDDER